MTQTALRPATLCRGEQAGTSDLAVQQIGFLNSKTTPKHQTHSRQSYTIEANCLVVNVEFGRRSVAVTTP